MTGWRLFILLILIVFVPDVAWSIPRVIELRADSGEQADRIILGFSQPVVYKVFTLPSPNRLVIDVPASQWEAGGTIPSSYPGHILKSVRFGFFTPETSRIVFDLNGPVEVLRSYIIPAADNFPNRLVVELKAAGKMAPVPMMPSQAQAPVTEADVIPPPRIKPEVISPEEQIPLVVVDPGHGGVDPGAIGENGTQEKNITLRYAKALRDALLKTGRYRVVLTREDDRFILLHDRVGVAKQLKADLFVSLHADSAPTIQARGLSVYTLSEKASDKEAEALAASENSADTVAGINISQTSGDVVNILIDLARRDTKNRSSHFADTIVDKVGRQVTLLPNPHRYAGFVVLKTLDIPSALIELGFISHPKEEDQLQTKDHMNKTIRGIVSSIDSFFAEVHP